MEVGLGWVHKWQGIKLNFLDLRGKLLGFSVSFLLTPKFNKSTYGFVWTQMQERAGTVLQVP